MVQSLNVSVAAAVAAVSRQLRQRGGAQGSRLSAPGRRGGAAEARRNGLLFRVGLPRSRRLGAARRSCLRPALSAERGDQAKSCRAPAACAADTSEVVSRPNTQNGIITSSRWAPSTGLAGAGPAATRGPEPDQRAPAVRTDRPSKTTAATPNRQGMCSSRAITVVAVRNQANQSKVAAASRTKT